MDERGKKEKLAAYKERKVVGGILAIKNSANGKTLLLSTTDMQGSKNRFAFSQQTGGCIHMKLQKDWIAFGAGVFALEVLDELNKKPTQTDGEFGDDIKALEAMWLDKFDAASLY